MDQFPNFEQINSMSSQGDDIQNMQSMVLNDQNGNNDMPIVSQIQALD